MKYLILHFAKSKVYYLLTLIIITFSSCSSYQNTTADNDGIYNTSTKTQEVEEVAVVTNESKIKTRKYEKYFKKNAEKYDITEEEVFTDIDTYKSEDEIEAEEEELDRDVDDFSYPNNSWEDSEETVVNVYNYGGYRSPYYYGGFYRPYYSYYNPFSFHFGWYGGFYNSWAYGCSPYYGYGNYGYYRPYYRPYYYGSNYGGYYGGHNDYAYGRRSARNTSFASKYDRNRSRTNTATRRSTSRDSNARTATRTRNNTNARNARRTNLNRTARPSQRTNRRVAPQRRVSPQKRNTSTRVRTNRSSSSRSVTPTRRSSSSRSKSVSSSRRSTSSRSSSTRSSSSRSSRRH